MLFSSSVAGARMVSGLCLELVGVDGVRLGRPDRRPTCGHRDPTHTHAPRKAPHHHINYIHTHPDTPTYTHLLPPPPPRSRAVRSATAPSKATASVSPVDVRRQRAR